MSLAIQKLPNGRHIVGLIGDPGPVPGEDDIHAGQEGGGFEGSTALVLQMKAYWSREIALFGDRVARAESVHDILAAFLCHAIAVEQWVALVDAV